MMKMQSLGNGEPEKLITLGVSKFGHATKFAIYEIYLKSKIVLQ